MATFIEALKTNDVADGAMTMVKLGGKSVLVARIKNKYYAVDNACAHFGGNLSKGKLEENIVTCPRHGSQYDVTNGNVLRWTKTPVKQVGVDPKASKNLKSYAVKVEGDKVFVEV